MHRPSVEKLFQNCPALASHFATASFSHTGTDVEQVLNELEDFLSGKEQGALQLTIEMGSVHRKVIESEGAVGRMLEYIRVLQILITRISEGRITPPVRAAVQHVVDAWTLHKAAIDLGQSPRDVIERHIAAMQGTAQILFGISLEELRGQVYDKAVAVGSSTTAPDGDFSPFDGVGNYKW